MDAFVWITLALTLKVALCATVINLLLGVSVGWLLARRRFPGRELLDATLTLPLVLPPTVLGYYLLVVIGKRGWLGQWLGQGQLGPDELPAMDARQKPKRGERG